MLKPTKTSGEALRAAGALSTVGLAFVLALAIGFWIGDRLDLWLGTAPLLTLVFFFLGLAAGILNVYRIVSQSFPAARGPGTSDDGTGPQTVPRPARTGAGDPPSGGALNRDDVDVAADADRRETRRE